MSDHDSPHALLTDVLAPLPPIIRRCSINLLAGAPGVGKTGLVAWLAVQFRDGLPIFGHQPTPIPKQVFISADRSWEESTHEWFASAGFPEMPAYALQDDREFKKSRLRKKQDRINVLRSCLEQPSLQPIPPGSIVWVDPLSLFLGGNLNDNDACMVACSEIREMCRDWGITIIGTAHASKQKADKAQRYLRLQDRICGSTSLFGYTDTQMYLASPEELDEPFYGFHWAPHHAKPETFKLERYGDHGLFQLYNDPEAGREQQLLEIIPFSPEMITSKAIVAWGEQLGLSRRTTYRFVDVLRGTDQIVQVGRGHYTRRAVH